MKNFSTKGAVAEPFKKLKNSATVNSTIFVDSVKQLNCAEKFKCTSVKIRVGNLELHELNSKMYSISQEADEALKDDVQANGIVNTVVWATSNMKVFAGCRRVRVLKELNPDFELDVYVVDLSEEEITQHIISSNQQRKKSIADIYNELMFLKKKLSPGQGNRADIKGEDKTNTIDKIAKLLGISASNLNKIKTIQEKSPELGKLIAEGKMSIHAAERQINNAKYTGSTNLKKSNNKQYKSWEHDDTPEEIEVTVKDKNDLVHQVELKNGNQIIIKLTLNQINHENN